MNSKYFVTFLIVGVLVTSGVFGTGPMERRRSLARVGHLACAQIQTEQDRTRHLCNTDSDCPSTSNCVQDDCVRTCKRPITLRDTGTWVQCYLQTGKRVDEARLNQDCGEYCRTELGGYSGGYCYPGHGTYWMGYCWCFS